jgi:O-antigen/teichoic acid export membrane protein
MLVSYFHGPVQVGIYNAGKIVYRLYSLFSQAAQVIILPIASKLNATNQLAGVRALFEKSIYFSYLILIPLNGGLLWATNWIFSQFYAGQYSEAIPVFRWLVSGAFLAPWGQVGANILLGAGKPQLNFRIIFIGVFVQLVAGIILIPRFLAVGAAIAMVITMLCSMILVIYHVKKLTGFTLQGILQRYHDVLNFMKDLRRKARIKNVFQKE